MLEYHKIDDLACIYKLFTRVDNGLKTITECVSNYLRTQGRKLIQEDSTQTNPVLFTQSIIDLKDKMELFLTNSFFGDKIFKQMIISDFEHFLNLNLKSPEYLSLYIDDKLKRSAKCVSFFLRITLKNHVRRLFLRSL